MNKVWLGSYPAGVPAEIDPCRYRSLTELLAVSCARFRDRPVCTQMGHPMRYGDLDRLSRDFAAYLQCEPSLKPGDRVAIMLPNLLQYPVVLFGILRAGLIVVNVNPLYTARELAEQLADSGAAAIVVLAQFAHTLAEALPQTAVKRVITTRVGDLLPAPQRWIVNCLVTLRRRPSPPRIESTVTLRSALALGRRHAFKEVMPGPDDTAFLQYTGGTTGRAKGVVLTHGNMVANVEQTAAWIAIALKEGEETVVTALPLYHIYALTANLLVFLRLGGNNLLVLDPRDLRRLVAELTRSRYTAISGVNTLFKALLDACGFDAVCAAHRGTLKVAVAGGMAVERAVAERWQRATGVTLIEGYGLTEASPIVCSNPLDSRAFSGSVGVPLPSTEVAILDDDGKALAFNEVGEIAVRGPQVMRGYWNAPKETRKAFTPDGWLLTGDIGRMDERGYVEFVDRKKEVIVVSGFKAYPTEIEEVARMHPGVRDAGAVGMPDAHSGEVVALFVVRRDPALTAQAVLEHCTQRLAHYKRPRRIEFRDALPMTSIGKIARRRLRDELLEGMKVSREA